MKTVYLVTKHHYEDNIHFGVFSHRKDAEAALFRLQQRDLEQRREEHELMKGQPLRPVFFDSPDPNFELMEIPYHD
jgi:hypothetical protein